MTRFEIQDIVRQNQNGVTFRALDTTTDEIVSLRRFFPFGQDNEDEEGGVGLDPQEGKAFSSACKKLSKIKHHALRKTIFGDTDPIDGMPYLVTEWIEGESLSDVLGNNTMDPKMIIGLVRQALDVCMILSSSLGNEAVWIDSKLDSIIVSNATENPKFSFRICPFKWLGTQSHTKDLTDIVSLVEALMGWKSKLVSDQAGLGLGGWLKLLRQNPEMKLSDAIQSLPDPASDITSEPTTTASYLPDQTPFILKSPNKPFFSAKNVIIMALSACFTGALIFFIYKQNVKEAAPATIPFEDDTTTTVEQKPETIEISPKLETTIPKSEIVIPKSETTIPKTEIASPKTKTWSPAEISTAAWYDASDTVTITANNGLVLQWNDMSGNNNHATQSTSALQPKTGTRTINNLNAIDFDDDTLSRVELNMAGKAIFAVVLADNTGDGGQIFSHSSSKINNQLRVVAGGRISYAAGLPRYLNSRPSTDTLTMNQPGIAGFIINTTMQYSVNGAFDDTGASEVSSVSTAFDQFGARGDNNAEALDGLIGEIIITDSIPDTDARQKIEGYLAHKWSLTGNLPADHPHKTLAPISSASVSETSKHLPLTEKNSKETKKTDPKTEATWSPSEIPSTAWYDASTATLKDGTVSIVNAGSSGGAISGPASLAANGIGNLQAVQFNGINQYLTGDSNNTVATLTVFFVGKSLNTNQAPYAGMMSIWENSQMYDWNNAGSAVLFSQNNTLANSIYTHRNSFILSSLTGTLTTGFLATTVFNGSTNTLYLNGTPSAGIASTDSFNANKVILGARWQKSAIAPPFWNGNFGETIICNTDLSTSDRQKIEGYLAHKWALAAELPADHPYKSSSPVTSVSEGEKSKKLSLIEKGKKETKTADPKLPLWLPSEITPAAWYDAADTKSITVSSGVVNQWQDKSTNGRHATQGKKAKQPAYAAGSLNGLNTVNFDGANDSMSVAGSIAVRNIFAVVNADEAGTTFSGWRWIFGSVTPRLPALFGAQNQTKIASNITESGVNLSPYINGVSGGEFSPMATFKVISLKGPAASVSSSAWNLGGGEASWNGKIAELIITSESISDADSQKIEGYLAHKWGLAENLPSNHPYKSSAPGDAPQIPDVLTSKDSDFIKRMKEGDPVKLQGIVRSAKLSSTEKSIYLSFSDPEVESDIRVVIHANEIEGIPFDTKEFAKLIKQEIVFNGTVYKEEFNDRAPFVKITERNQIKLATKTPDKPNDSEKAVNRPVFTPDESQAIAKLELKEPVTIKGIVKSVKINKAGGGLYFAFSDPLISKQIQVVTYEKGFEGGFHDSAAFKKIEAELQNLVGKTVTFNGTVFRQKNNNTSQFVFISKREDIVVEAASDKATSDAQNKNDKPDIADPAKNTKTNTRLKLQGTLRAVKLNTTDTAIVIQFIDPHQAGQIRAVAYKANYKDPFDIKNFEPFVGKKVSINAPLIIDANNDKFVEITDLKQITIIEK